MQILDIYLSVRYISRNGDIYHIEYIEINFMSVYYHQLGRYEIEK